MIKHACERGREFVRQLLEEEQKLWPESMLGNVTIKS